MILPLVMPLSSETTFTSINRSLNIKACCYEAALGYITSSSALILGRVECGVMYSILPTPGRLRRPKALMPDQTFPSILWPGSLQINMQAKSVPHPLLTLLYVWAFLSYIDPDTHFLPPRELPFSAYESFIILLECLHFLFFFFSLQRKKEVGQPGSRAAHSGPLRFHRERFCIHAINAA